MPRTPTPVIIVMLSCCFALLGGCGSRSSDKRAASFDDPVPYCDAVGTIDRPDARYRGPAVPDWLAEALRRATGGAPTAPLEFFKQARWRCANGDVLACSYGANIPCGEKADPRRAPSAGARGFCGDNPGAAVVPAYATGRATVFEWRCEGRTPAVVRQVTKVDDEGYPAIYWYRVTRK